MDFRIRSRVGRTFVFFGFVVVGVVVERLFFVVLPEEAEDDEEDSSRVDCWIRLLRFCACCSCSRMARLNSRIASRVDVGCFRMILFLGFPWCCLSPGGLLVLSLRRFVVPRLPRIE